MSEQEDKSIIPHIFRSSMKSYVLSILMYFILIFDLFLFWVVYRMLNMEDPRFNWRAFGYELFEYTILALIISLIYLKIWGAKSIIITDSAISVKRPLLPSKKMLLKDIKLTSLETPRNLLVTIFGEDKIRNDDNLMIYSLDGKMEIKLRLYADQDGIVEVIKNLNLEHDQYIKRYINHRSTFNIYNLVKHPTGMFGVILVGITLFFYIWGAMNYIFFPPSVASPLAFGMANPAYSYAFSPLGEGNLIDAPPSSEFPLGTDFVGRDYYSRIIYGMVLTLNLCFLMALLTMVYAVIVGTIAGMGNTAVDRILLGVMDALISVPMMIFWAFGLIYSGGLRDIEGFYFDGAVFWNIMLITSIFIWAAPAKIIRNDIRNLRSMEYIKAEYILGATKFYIFRKHIVPSVIPIVFTLLLSMIIEYISLTIAIAILLPSEGTLIWGSDLNRRLDINYYPDQNVFDSYFMFSTAIFSVTIFGFLLLGSALKDLANFNRRQ
ncbi:MAG: ABC transporter permease [Candidatus Heimdallarchaeota archaeon]|nr:ABC transporter permease [Candidatus Heimdallarchaeota archaeon]